MVDLHNFFAKHRMKGPFLLALSGGVDSMVLGHLLVDAQIPFQIAHVHHGWRVESDEEARFIQTWADNHGLACHIKKLSDIDFDGIAGSKQMQARAIRYTWFKSLLADQGLTQVLFAHHQDDWVETLFLNWARGTGPRGYGMPEVSEWLARPLLTCTKTDIRAFALAQGITWKEDASNASDEYRRNELRNHILPSLRTLHEGWDGVVRDNRERLLGWQELLADQLQWLQKKYGQKVSDHHRIDLEWFNPERRKDILLLTEWLASYGLSFQEVKDLVRSTGSGKQLLSSSHQVVMDRNQLIITPLGQSPEEVRWTDRTESVRFGDYTFRAMLTDHAEVNTHPLTGQFDADSLPWPLEISSWRNGDRFQPLGSAHTKKLSDFMIDQKIPLNLKARVPILRCGANICWVVGYRQDDRFKFHPTSKRVVTITAVHDKAI